MTKNPPADWRIFFKKRANAGKTPVTAWAFSNRKNLYNFQWKCYCTFRLFCTIVDSAHAQNIFEIIDDHFKSKVEPVTKKSKISEAEEEKYVFSDFEELSDFDVDSL